MSRIKLDGRDSGAAPGSGFASGVFIALILSQENSGVAVLRDSDELVEERRPRPPWQRHGSGMPLGAVLRTRASWAPFGFGGRGQECPPPTFLGLYRTPTDAIPDAAEARFRTCRRNTQVCTIAEMHTPNQTQAMLTRIDRFTIPASLKYFGESRTASCKTTNGYALGVLAR